MAERITRAMIEARIRNANSWIGGEPFVLDSGYGNYGVMRGGKRIVNLSSTSACFYEFCAYTSGYYDAQKDAKARQEQEAKP